MRELMSLAILIGTAVSAMVLFAALLTHGILVMRGRQKPHERPWPRLFSPVNRDARDGAPRPPAAAEDSTRTAGRVVLNICPQTPGDE